MATVGEDRSPKRESLNRKAPVIIVLVFINYYYYYNTIRPIPGIVIIRLPARKTCGHFSAEVVL